MYQSTAQRFARTKNNDLFVTFFPLLLAFGLRGALRKAALAPEAFTASQLLLAVFLAGAFLLSYRFYFRSFRYTVAEGEGSRAYPAGSLTFERLYGEKARIYERVLREEVLCLSGPGEPGPGCGGPAKTYRLTALSPRGAHRLYYRQEGTLYCAVFHPDARQQAALERWARGNHPTL